MALPGTLSAAGAEWTPTTSVAGTSSNSSWHKRYVKNVTKGVSTLLWGHGKKGHSPSFESPPLHGFRPVIDWSHVTYPSQESIPTLDFHVARKAVIAKKAKGSTGANSPAATAPMLHRRLARTSFQLSPPLTLEAQPACFESGESRQLLKVAHARSQSRWSVSGSSLTAVSTGAGSSSPVENIYRCVEALGVLSVLPFEIVKTDLFGEVTHRVDFRVTHLLHATFGEVLGIGEVLICVTAAFTIAVYRVRDLRLLYDIPVHLAENLWMRYYRRHTRHPPPNLNDSRITALAVSPSSFSRRHGLVVVGSSSGLTHVWKVPERVLISVLPPPLSRRQAVLGLAFASTDLVECIKDIASPFSRPETSETLLRRNYLLVFYMDGQFAMWSHSLTRLKAASGELPELSVGRIPPHLQFHYPSIESPLRVTDDFALEKLLQWRLDPATAHTQGSLALESVLECGDCVTLFVKVGEHDYGFILIHPQSKRVVEPLVTFQELGIPIAVHHPAAVCYALLEGRHRCFIVATPGVLRVIEVQHADRGVTLDETETHLTFDMSFDLRLLATLPVIRKTEFCKAKYDADFDELLLGLTTGEVVKIDGLSDLVLHA